VGSFVFSHDANPSAARILTNKGDCAESTCGYDKLVNPEACFTQRRQALPLGVQIIATDNFDKVSDQDLDGAELVPLV
jgi:hypothetical protein